MKWILYLYDSLTLTVILMYGFNDILKRFQAPSNLCIPHSTFIINITLKIKEYTFYIHLKQTPKLVS